MNKGGRFDPKRKPKSRNVKRRKNNQILDSEQLQEVKEAFNLFDSDENGLIDAREFKAALRALGFNVKKVNSTLEIGRIEKNAH